MPHDVGLERAVVALCQERPLTEELLSELVATGGFADEQAAKRRLQALIRDPRLGPALAARLPDLLPTLAAGAGPDRALLNLERLAHAVGGRQALLDTLAAAPRSLEALVTILAGSQFLSEILLREPGQLQRLSRLRSLARLKSAAELAEEAQAAAGLDPILEGQLDGLRRYHRSELLRVGACDLLGLLDLPAVTGQLSHLADGLVRAALAVAARESRTPVAGLAVIALGKLGGRELNYSSDIDLLLIARSGADAYKRLGEWLIEALARVTGEGFLYRVDMRLRPWGRTGPLISSLAGHLAYLRQHARLWEKQALLKARVVAGDEAVGREFLRRAGPLLFSVDREAARTDVRDIKRRIEGQLRQRGREWGEVKLGRGSIRDVEFVAQYLQLIHGGERPAVRGRNTLDALARLRAFDLLPADDYRTLVDGYTFLRPVEHYLQLMHNRQTHTLPHDLAELDGVARRLGFSGADSGAQLLTRYQQHAAAIRAVYQRHLEGEDVKEPAKLRSQPAGTDVGHHMARMAPSYAATFTEAEIRHHATLAGRLDDANLVEVDAVPMGEGLWRVTLVGYDYPGELSLICGLLFAYGFGIRDGHVFTYEPTGGQASHRGSRRKIVDVLNVQQAFGEVEGDVWARYAHDLTQLLRRLEVGEQREAQGELARRVAAALGESQEAATTLYPIDIQIDNDASDRYTALSIDTPDTIGFLYEFTNALALNNMYIAQVTVETVGSRVRDTVYLSDASGHKITSPERQNELRAATVLVKHFTHLLPHSPNPESALVHFGEFLGQLFARPNWPAELASLERPEVLGALARLLGVSDFLWDDFLRMQHANLFPVVRDVDALAHPRSKEWLQAELAAALQAAADGTARRAALNAFKDREMFRIDMRHIQGYSLEFGRFSGELTDLAEVIVDAAYRLCEGEMRAEYGPALRDDSRPCRVAVCVLGKCGGRELGFASDVELMFVVDGGGRTAGPRAVSSAEYHEELVRRFVAAIHTRRAGVFEIDLQLRPYGRAGSLAVSLDSFARYFAPSGPAWSYERQALVKLRPLAGDAELGAEVLDLRDRFVYSGEPLDAAEMRAMRERQMRQYVAGGTVNAKYSPGGLADVEYLVQRLQIAHGHRNPGLRLTNTREAMQALASAGILTAEDHARLHVAHVFLRYLIDALRMVRGNARDLTIPSVESEEFAFLCRRLRYGGDSRQLYDDLQRYTIDVQEIGRRLLQ